MLWSATVSNFTELLLDAALPRRRHRRGRPARRLARRRLVRRAGSAAGSTACILAGEYVGAGFGFAVTGDIAALSWRAAFVDPRATGVRPRPGRVAAAGAGTRRQGRARLGQGASAAEPSARRDDDLADDRRAAARARARASTPDPELVVGPGEARRIDLVARHPLRAARAHEPHPHRRERVRLLLPRRPADVRPRSSRGSSTGSTRRSRTSSCSSSASVASPACCPAASLGDWLCSGEDC